MVAIAGTSEVVFPWASCEHVNGTADGSGAWPSLCPQIRNVTRAPPAAAAGAAARAAAARAAAGGAPLETGAWREWRRAAGAGRAAVAGRAGGRLLPAKGRELLAAAKLGVPGAQERVDTLLREAEAERERNRAHTRGRAYWREQPPGWDARAGWGARGGGGGVGAPRRARDPQGHYAALGLGGLADRATLADIKAAFRGKAKRLHPDAAGPIGGPPGERPQSAESFRRAVAAYQLLRDPEERRRYDSL